MATVAVPAHYWFSRWRWQSAPRPVIPGAAAAALAMGWLPPYSNAGPPSTPVLATRPKAPPPYTIMGLAGITPYMPTTGDRDDIGPMTEWEAGYLMTGAPDLLAGILAQAEASGTIPWHMRDENTGAPLDFIKNPTAGWTGSQAVSASKPYIPVAPTPIAVDHAHHPSLTYVPFLLTDDPYYLEELQFTLTFCLGADGYAYTTHNNNRILPIGQVRSFAWSLRDLFQLVIITPVVTPSWLMPRSYWKTILDNNRAWFTDVHLNSAAPEDVVFRSIKVQPLAPAGPSFISPWQHDYLSFILGWMQLAGLTEWRPIFDWAIGNQIARCSGLSGWPRAFASVYELIVRNKPTDPVAASWADAWTLHASVNSLTLGDPNVFAIVNSGYLGWMRGVLAIAVRLGTPNAAESLAWADAAIKMVPPTPPMKFGTTPGIARIAVI